MENEFKDGNVIKSYNVAIFLKNLERYFQQKKTTTLEISVDTETEEKHFIADVNPTVFSKFSKMSLGNDLYTIKGEPDFEYLFSLYMNLPKGQPAPIDMLIVYKAFGNKSEGYKAWHFPEARIMFTSYNAKESTLNYDYNFGEGEVGVVKMLDGTPKFTAEGAPA